MYDLKAFSEYKASSQPWLGGVPKHWDLTTIGAITTRRSDRNRTDLPLLSVLREKGVVLRSSLGGDENHNFVPDDLSNYRVALKGDLVINKMKAWQGSVGIAPCDGIVSPAYFVFELSKITQEFVHRLFRSKSYVAFFAQASDGVRIGQWDLSIDRMKRIPVPIPPPTEQAAIVQFLSVLDRRVNQFVRTKRRLIELLTEQKQAIVTHAVTRGLNPKAKFKSSGIDWLGDVPEHWRVSRVKTEMKNLNTRRIPLNGTARGAMIARTYDYYGASGVIDKVENHLFDDDEGLLLIAEDGANLVLRNLPLAIIARGKFWVNNHAHILKPNRGSIEYFAAILECIDYAPWITGAAQPKLTQDRLMAVRIPVPPPEEQIAIMAFATRETRLQTQTIIRTQREIDLIREYRVRLVADVVTGKVDVRTASFDVHTVIDTQRKANVHFQRSVFAAEIICRLHSEPTFGHVKFEKTIYMCEKRCGVDTGSTYHRDAAGPYDNRAIRSIDSQVKKQKWYAVEKGEQGYRYVPMEKAGGHRTYFERYFGAVKSKFDEIIETFRAFDTQQCAIVATLYSAWDDLLANGTPTDEQIIEQVLNHWHPSKKIIDEDRWRKALGWMKKRGLIPMKG